MSKPRRIILIGNSTLMAVTEAALRASPNLDVRRVADITRIENSFDAVIVECDLPNEETAAIAQLCPNIPIIQMDWQHASLWLLSQSDNTLDAERLVHLLEIFTPPFRMLSQTPSPLKK
jgi:hypothetical protein